MKLARTLSALSVAAATFALAAHGYAYCLTRTCDPASGKCEFDGICNISGKPLFWPNSCISFDVQKDGSTLRGVSYDTTLRVATQAFQQWENADCGGGTHPLLMIADLGAIDCAKPEYNQNSPNANVITFHDATWQYTNTADTVALTTVFFNGDTGEIYDANVEINSNQYKFADGNPAFDQVDLNAVLTHEVGHFLGLSHSSVASATMFQSYDADMATLDPDDETAICLAVAPNRVVTSASCTPRHGFSGECGMPESGGCATAIGASASRNQSLVLLAFGLGWYACRLRRGVRRSARALRG